MNIDHYSFGRIIIDNKAYNSDLIIYPNRIDTHWWRKEGHLLQIDDIADVIKENPETIIIGTGYSGVMKVSNDALRLLRSKGIDVIIEKTSDAVNTFNQISKHKKTIACLHLTC